jgi:hypothetical protein
MAVSMVLLRIRAVVPRFVMPAASMNIRVSAKTNTTSTAIAASTSIRVKAALRRFGRLHPAFRLPNSEF